MRLLVSALVLHLAFRHPRHFFEKSAKLIAGEAVVDRLMAAVAVVTHSVNVPHPWWKWIGGAGVAGERNHDMAAGVVGSQCTGGIH